MILVINAGSSSLKVSIFNPETLAEEAEGMVGAVGGAGSLQFNGEVKAVTTADHAEALELMLAALADKGFGLDRISAAGHRVVHGGATLTAPARITRTTRAEIEACIPLAPLHNPVNLAAIDAMITQAPGLPQYASFDTAFHATNPPVATAYALPKAARDSGIRRYGFHGMSYAGMVEHFGTALPRRLLALHLGNGASLCAILEGRSVATSMGYSPLEGLTMGTRAGSIDGAAVLRLAEEHGLARTDRMLNKESGLKGLAGQSDMRQLLGRAANDDAEAQFAVDHFCYWAARHAGSAMVAMGGVDAMAFTGGIGENAGAIRERIMSHLAFLGDVPVHVVAAEEEKQIARDAAALIAKGA